MLVKKDALNLAMAERCMNPYEVCRNAGISYQTFRKVHNGKRCKPTTIGKIAKALNVPVELLVLTESGEGK